jgi:hypothetical protein
MTYGPPVRELGLEKTDKKTSALSLVGA